MASKSLARIGADASAVAALSCHNIATCKDFLSHTPLELRELSDVGGDRFDQLLAMVCAATVPPCVKASTLYAAAQHKSNHVPLGIEGFDSLLGGGLLADTVTEVVGPPGCGKTQLCLQAALHCALPPDLGGRGADVLYVDTEGSFTPERILEMGRARYPAFFSNPEAEQWLLGRIHVSYEPSCSGIVNRLHACELHAIECGAGLLVLDSVAAAVRKDYAPTALTQRNDWLAQTAARLKYLAGSFSIPVLVTNHVTTQFSKEPDGGTEGSVVAALGNTWSHGVNTRLVLEYSALSARCLRVAKSPVAPLVQVVVAIEAAGIVPRGAIQPITGLDRSASAPITARSAVATDMAVRDREEYVDFLF